MTPRRFASLMLPLAVAACGGGEAPPATFAPLSFDYLRPIRLNVAALDVEDHAATRGDDMAAQSPVPPAQALTQMAHDRIFPGGASGRAVFVIQDASIHRRGDTLAGSLAVRLDIVGPGGQAAGFAEASVARSSTTGEGDLRTREYALTRQMMDDMNVEFEFQVRRGLKGWLQPEGDVPAAVSVQPLGGPGGGPAVAAPGYGAAAGVPGRVPDAAGVGGPAMSPPPTDLALPSGYPDEPGVAYPGTGAAMPAASPYSPGAAPATPERFYQAPAAGASSYGQTPYAAPPYAAPPYAAPPYVAPSYALPPGLQSGPLPLTE